MNKLHAVVGSGILLAGCAAPTEDAEAENVG